MHFNAYISIWLGLLVMVNTLGLTIPSVMVGNQAKYSSLKNLQNCVTYSLSKDEIMLLSVNSGERQTSQNLNLVVLDSENNVLRSAENLAHEETFIITFLTAPDIQTRNGQVQTTYVHVCFDNVYTDKSFSFHKHDREVYMMVKIRNRNNIQETNYNNYAKYFDHMKNLEGKKVTKENEYLLDFSEADFEIAINQVNDKLSEVSEELRGLESDIRALHENEWLLRNVNEAIYEKYTRVSIILIACTCIFGLCQIIYFKCFLKLRKLI